MIEYRKGYKYQLARTAVTMLAFCPPKDIRTGFIELTRDGALTTKKGYAWDGPSGLSFDTKNFMRGSLVHDALYQLMRESLLPLAFKGLADLELHRLCRADGMSTLRAWYVYQAVNLFGMSSARPQTDPVLTAP